MNKKNRINKENINKKLDALRKNAEDNLAGWKRAKADYENLKRRTEEDKKKTAELLNAELISEILPIVDNFENAYKNIPEGIKNNDWVKGIVLIKNQLEKFLHDNEVYTIKSEGEEFNPEWHEAVELINSDEKKGTIVEVVQKGYKLKNKVIRPARVKVAN
jgi:molecular chaperone GrpE